HVMICRTGKPVERKVWRRGERHNKGQRRANSTQPTDFAAIVTPEQAWRLATGCKHQQQQSEIVEKPHDRGVLQLNGAGCAVATPPCHRRDNGTKNRWSNEHARQDLSHY